MIWSACVVNIEQFIDVYAIQLFIFVEDGQSEDAIIKIGYHEKITIDVLHHLFGFDVVPFDNTCFEFSILRSTHLYYMIFFFTHFQYVDDLGTIIR